MDKMDWILNGLTKSGILTAGYADSDAAISTTRDINPTLLKKEPKAPATATNDISSPSRISLFAYSGGTVSSGLRKEQENYVFEAYYVVPRSLARNSPKGSLHVIREGSGDYMAVAIDTRSLEPNYCHAIARAPAQGIPCDSRKQQAQVAAKISKLPDSAAKEILWLIGDRINSSEDNHCAWIEIQELPLAHIVPALLSVHTSAYLVVIRCKLDQPRAILPAQGNLQSVLTYGSSSTRHASEYPQTEASVALKRRALDKDLARIVEANVAEDVMCRQGMEEEISKMENGLRALEREKAQNWLEWDRKMFGNQSSPEASRQMGVELAQQQEELDRKMQSQRSGSEERLHRIEIERARKKEEMRELMREKQEEIRRLEVASSQPRQDEDLRQSQHSLSSLWGPQGNASSNNSGLLRHPALRPLPSAPVDDFGDGDEWGLVLHGYSQEDTRQEQSFVDFGDAQQKQLPQEWDLPVMQSQEPMMEKRERSGTRARIDISLTMRKETLLKELAELKSGLTRADLIQEGESEKVKRQLEIEEQNLEAVKSLHRREVDQRLVEPLAGREDEASQIESKTSEYHQNVDRLEWQILVKKGRLREIEEERAQGRQNVDQIIKEKEEELIRVAEDWMQAHEGDLVLPQEADPLEVSDVRLSKPMTTQIDKGSRIRHFFRQEKNHELVTSSMGRGALVRQFFRKGKDKEPKFEDVHCQGSSNDKSEKEKKINDFIASFSTLYEKD